VGASSRELWTEGGGRKLFLPPDGCDINGKGIQFDPCTLPRTSQTRKDSAEENVIKAGAQGDTEWGKSALLT